MNYSHNIYTISGSVLQVAAAPISRSTIHEASSFEDCHQECLTTIDVRSIHQRLPSVVQPSYYSPRVATPIQSYKWFWFLWLFPDLHQTVFLSFLTFVKQQYKKRKTTNKSSKYSTVPKLSKFCPSAIFLCCSLTSVVCFPGTFPRGNPELFSLLQVGSAQRLHGSLGRGRAGWGRSRVTWRPRR